MQAALAVGRGRVGAAEVGANVVAFAADVFRVAVVDMRTGGGQLLRFRVDPEPTEAVGATEQVDLIPSDGADGISTK